MTYTGKLSFPATYPLIGTKHKPAALHLQQRSPYYWWWAYLRRNQDYLDCCASNGQGALAQLYADFGDVRSDDFRSWWGGKEQRGGKLFGERPLEFRLKKLASRSEWPAEWDDSKVLVVAVNLDTSLTKRELQRYFANLLKTEHKGRRGRPALREVKSTAKYSLYRNYSQHNLKTMLSTYDAWWANEQLPKAERLPLWAIGESIKLVPTAMPDKGETKKAATSRHNVMTVAVSRYVRTAKVIIANTAKGEFPNSDN